jgi:queuine tRNA-ribosyltransferase
MRDFQFELIGRDRTTGARAGLLHTPHGDVPTPIFMPVGTQATVKAVDTDELRSAGARIILGNTYHLDLRPGHEVVERLGGLHGFMGWDRPILTDSGGFQVFSLAKSAQGRGQRGEAGLVQIDESGVTFESHLDQRLHRFTPESAIEVQTALGADVIMAFDECSRTNDDFETTLRGMERTHRWAERCRARWREMETEKQRTTGRPPQALFGIVQGGTFRDLRRASAEVVVGLDLPGVAIGGESIGYSKPLTRAILEWIGDLLPADRPRYAMGVGDPDDFFAIVERGVDMFDCVLPTRMARNGTLLTRDGRLRVVNAEYASDARPIEPGCDCYTCARFSRGYLRHLLKSESLLAYRLATLHNVRFCLRLVEEIRAAIIGGQFAEMRDEFMARWKSGSG